MTGIGHFFDMVGRIKENEKLRKNIRFFRTLEKYQKPFKIRKVRYKRASEAELEKIRQEIKEENRKQGVHMLLAVLVSVLIFAGLFLIISALT